MIRRLRRPCAGAGKLGLTALALWTSAATQNATAQSVALDGPSPYQATATPHVRPVVVRDLRLTAERSVLQYNDAPTVVGADAPSASDVAPPAAPTACPHCGSTASATNASIGCRTCCHGTCVDWKKYPETIRPMARPGMFTPTPSGPGYYSAWDHLTGTCRDGAPRSGYANQAINAWPFFDADWRYVEQLDPCDRTLVERLKRIHLNDCWKLSTGGEFWTRYHDETNSRLTRTNNEFTLGHVRQYADLWYKDGVRIYGEYIWADIWGEDLPPTMPDVDRGDILNLFVDVNLGELAGKPVYVRGGRQELIYGSQRLVSPLPWVNRRHTFDGVKVFRRGEKWDFDAFWTQYVPAQASEFDSSDDDQTFVGAWLTNRPRQGETVDLYYLMYDNDNTVNQQGIARNPSQTHTYGSRWSGDHEGFLWDFEGAVQFGDQAGSDLFAGMGTAGIGRSWKDAFLSPTIWLYYDYASGDSDPTSGDAHTFTSPFPFGHHYLGWMDLVGRQNIHDVNAHLYLYPAPWMSVWLQYHHFWLDESRDSLYNASGVAYRRDATGAAGHNVGDEVDVVLNFHLTRYSDLLVSYNKLFGGSFLEATAGPGQAADAESLYLLYQQRW